MGGGGGEGGCKVFSDMHPAPWDSMGKDRVGWDSIVWYGIEYDMVWTMYCMVWYGMDQVWYIEIQDQVKKLRPNS